MAQQKVLETYLLILSMSVCNLNTHFLTMSAKALDIKEILSKKEYYYV